MPELGARLPRVSAEWPPPASVILLRCPRCETHAKLTDRLVREAYTAEVDERRAVCVACANGAGELVDLAIVYCRPIRAELRELAGHLQALERAQARSVDHEAAIALQRAQAIRDEMAALERYRREVLAGAAIEGLGASRPS